MQYPYTEYRRYCIFHKGLGRWMMIFSKPGHKFTMSAARYKMSMHVGRDLLPTEHVDHIDNDKSNDDIKNLQILTAEENNAKYAHTLTKAWASTNCPVCGIKIDLPWKNTHIAKRSGNYTTCGRTCGSSTRNLDVDQIIIKYYK